MREKGELDAPVGVGVVTAANVCKWRAAATPAGQIRRSQTKGRVNSIYTSNKGFMPHPKRDEASKNLYLLKSRSE